MENENNERVEKNKTSKVFHKSELKDTIQIRDECIDKTEIILCCLF